MHIITTVFRCDEPPYLSSYSTQEVEGLDFKTCLCSTNMNQCLSNILAKYSNHQTTGFKGIIQAPLRHSFWSWATTLCFYLSLDKMDGEHQESFFPTDEQMSRLEPRVYFLLQQLPFHWVSYCLACVPLPELALASLRASFRRSAGEGTR